jgi:hypothetical protein
MSLVMSKSKVPSCTKQKEQNLVTPPLDYSVFSDLCLYELLKREWKSRDEKHRVINHVPEVVNINLIYALGDWHPAISRRLC